MHRIDRRRLMKTMGAMTLTATAGTIGSPALAQQVPWSSGTESPQLKVPANACDRHMHTISKVTDKGKGWVKLSGAYQDTKVGPRSYSDTVPLARAYIKLAPERMVWASDWPHPTEKDKPNDAVLLDLLAKWASDQAARERILVQNPAALYGFPTSV